MNRDLHYDLLTIGDMSIDIYMKVEDTELVPYSKEESPKICFLHGAKIPVSKEETNISGNSINVAMGAQKLGMHSAIYTETGDDEHYKGAISKLNKAGIMTDLVIPNENEETDIHPVLVAGGDRTIFSYHSKREYKMQQWGHPKWIYYTSLSHDFERFQQNLVDYLRQNRHIILAMNPGTYQLKKGLNAIRNILEVAHVLFVNKTEALQLISQNTNKHLLNDTPDEFLHQSLQKLGPKLTVITKGKSGATASDGHVLQRTKAYTVKDEVVDMTGAGDSFASGFLAALHHKRSLREALIWGTINSAHVIQQIGSIHGLVDLPNMSKLALEAMQS